MSLKQFFKKIKGFYNSCIKRLIWLWIIVLSLVNSYILGFLSNYNNDFKKLEITQDLNLEIKSSSVIKIDGEQGSIVASKNGTKYYFLHCGGVGRINDENKVYFDSEDSAIKDGYEKASGCE